MTTDTNPPGYGVPSTAIAEARGRRSSHGWPRQDEEDGEVAGHHTVVDLPGPMVTLEAEQEPSRKRRGRLEALANKLGCEMMERQEARRGQPAVSFTAPAR